MTRGDDPGDRDPVSTLWTVALFLVGIGLCVGSYVLFSEFTRRDLGIVQPLDGTDQLLVGDPAVTGSRTISRFEYLMPRFLADLAPWLGGIGLATIVANVFRLAGFEWLPRRREAIGQEDRHRITEREQREAKES
jgi:hypothetical protein